MDLALNPLLGGFGARVDHNLTDLRDVGDHTDHQLAGHLTAALLRHRMLIFPGQHLNHADLLTVSSLFGTVDVDVDRRYAVRGFPGITVVSNIVEDGTRAGIYDGDHEEEWHADNSFKQKLTRVTLLYSVITPQRGGETRFADATGAYNDLAADVKEQIRELRAVHSIQQLAVRQAQAAGGRSSTATGTLVNTAEVEHPLAPIHPSTGMRSLLLGSMVVKGVVGLTDDESRRVLQQLLAHTTSAPYLYTHRWSQGDLVIWDNRALLHTASACDSRHNPRLLFRTSVC